MVKKETQKLLSTTTNHYVLIEFTLWPKVAELQLILNYLQRKCGFSDFTISYKQKRPDCALLLVIIKLTKTLLYWKHILYWKQLFTNSTLINH